MHMIAADFVRFSEHDMDVFLGRELGIGQGLEQAPARIAMCLHGLRGDPRGGIRGIHARDC